MAVTGYGRIAVEVDPELRELVPVYLANRGKDLEVIRDAVERNDFGTICSIAHNMQGSGGSFGFNELTAIGVELERAARDRSGVDMARQIRRLDEYLSSLHLVCGEQGDEAAGTCQSAADPVASDTAAGVQDGAGERGEILVIDDQEMNATIMSRYLGREGYSVKWLASGEAALTALADRPLPDLILLDVVMAGMSGFEVCRRIKSSSATCGIPVVLVTSFDRRSEFLQGWAAGADDVLSKPVRRDELVKRVRLLVRAEGHAGHRKNGADQDART